MSFKKEGKKNNKAMIVIIILGVIAWIYAGYLIFNINI